MKKLIVFSVIFALLTGAAFAQVNFGAEFKTGVTLLHGNTDDDDFPFAAAAFDDDGWVETEGSLTFSYETDGGEAGVAGIIEVGDTLAMDGAAWWFPIPQVKLLIGGAGFDRGDLTWAHYEEGSGNWFGISILPVDFLTINLAFIEEGKNPGELAYQYGDVIMVQVIFDIPNDFGQVGFTFDNNYTDPDGNVWGMSIFLDYYGEFEVGPSPLGVGVGFVFVTDEEDEDKGVDIEDSFFILGLDVSYSIVGVDLGFWFETLDFDLINLGFSAGYGLDIDPFSLYLAASIDINNLTGEDNIIKNDGDMYIGWEIGATLSRVIGGFTFELGFTIDSDTADETEGVNISVPVTFSYSF